MFRLGACGWWYLRHFVRLFFLNFHLFLKCLSGDVSSSIIFAVNRVCLSNLHQELVPRRVGDVPQVREGAPQQHPVRALDGLLVQVSTSNERGLRNHSSDLSEESSRVYWAGTTTTDKMLTLESPSGRGALCSAHFA